MHLRSEFGGLQEWHSIFGGENDVHQNKGGRPFGARRRGGRYPGLKPRAESCSPFGAKTVLTPCLSGAIRDRSDKKEGERRPPVELYLERNSNQRLLLAFELTQSQSVGTLLGFCKTTAAAG